MVLPGKVTHCQEHHEANGKLKAIFDSSPLRVIALDLEGRVTMWSPGAENIFGWTSQEVMGEFNPIITDAGWDKFWSHFESVIKEGKITMQVVRKYCTKKGDHIDIGISAAPLLGFNGEIIGAMGMHQDVTKFKQVQQECLSREKELTQNKKELEEINSALRVLLKKREQDKVELEDNVLANVEKVIFPILTKLQKRLTGKDKIYVDMLESNLEEIVSPFTKRMSFKYLNLTPSELQVASFIKQGMSTKEIADFLNLSPKTIEDHRKNMRRKLGISNSKINLRTQLSFINED